MTAPEKLSICQVRLTPVPALASGELSSRVFRKCSFCEKNYEVVEEQAKIIEKLAGPEFHCPFCIRHNLHTKANRDVLILSFRSIIGYYYFQYYVQGERNKLWLCEIEDYIRAHERAGLVNPLFLYDPETMLWFVDFSKVGHGRKKVPVAEITKTVSSILVSFNLTSLAPEISLWQLSKKYHEAIESFYHKRFRPDNRRMLIPTFKDCGVQEPKTFTLDKTRYFVLDDLQAKK